MPFADPDMEKLYAVTRFLLLKLPQDPRRDQLDLEGEVALRYYRLERMTEGGIGLAVSENVPIYGPTEVGSRKAKDEDVPLSEIIEVLYERFGTSFTKADQLFFDQVTEKAKADGDVVQKAEANAFDNFALAIKEKVLDLMLERMGENSAIVSRYMNESEFREIAFRGLAQKIYDEVRSPGAKRA